MGQHFRGWYPNETCELREWAQRLSTERWSPNLIERFIEAQAPIYATALAEIRRGAKHSHWMWFVFPQVAGLGHSKVASYYEIHSLGEAKAYLRHSVLGPRYLECVSTLQDLVISNPVDVFGETDAMKLRSSLTLFEAAGAGSLVGAALDRWFGGERDKATLALLSR